MSKKAFLFIDGASKGNPGPAAVGVVLKGADFNKKFHKYIGIATNNVAEYLALIYGLQLALFEGIREAVVKTDSQLLANQMNGSYKIKNSNLKIFYDLNKQLISFFDSCKIIYIPRSQNEEADELANQAITGYIL